MLGTTHIAFGVLFALPFYMVWGEGNLIVFGFAVFGSLLPDIDHPGSFISRLHPSTQFLSQHITKLKIVKHRGYFHSILAVIIFSFVAVLLALYFNSSLLYPFFFFIGYISHLAADSLTYYGIEWLQPFSKWKVHGRIRTGKEGEIFLFALILVFLIFVGLWQMGFFESM